MPRPSPRLLLGSQVASWINGPIVLPGAPGVALPNIGDNVFGGYYAGLIDTTRAGAIISGDASATGLKYMLIMAPKSLELAPGTLWKTTNDAGPTGVRTRWDGLTASEAMAAAGAVYQAATYCHGLTYPGDGYSRWYLPAMDELELLYRNLKPTTDANYVTPWTSSAGSYPYNGAAVNHGYDPASDPSGAAHTSGAPAQSGLALFQTGGAQCLDGVTSVYYWVSTEYDAANAWNQYAGGGYAGFQNNSNKANTLVRVRPVRRVVL
jgi:hypothetical protein